MAGAEASAEKLRLRCLGVPLLCLGTDQHTLTQQHARLLSVLVAAGPAGLETDGILESLWGENLPRTGAQAVYSLVGRLTSKVDLIINEGGRYRIAEPVDVDAWRFDDLSELDDIDALLEGIRLWQGRPFDGIEAGDVVALEANRLLRKRITATEAVARRATPEQLREVEEQILDATNDDPYNEPLVIATASALYRLNRRRDALSILHACRTRLRIDLGLGGSAELDAAELALLNDQNPMPVEEQLPSRPLPTIDPLPLLLTPRASLFVGRDDNLASITNAWSSATEPNGRGRVVLLHGEAGIGKSELAAQFASATEGANVRAGSSTAGSSAAYATWLRAFPEAADALAELGASPDPGAANLIFWREVERTIAAIAETAPLVVVLEDLHQADPQSTLLFSWLASGSLPSQVLIVATTRPPEIESPWSSVVRELRSRGDTGVATVIDVDPLSLGAIQQMVAARFTDETPARVFRFASQVHELSQGNPLVGSALISNAEKPDDLITGSALTIEEHHAQAVCSRVDSVVAGVLTNAGLIGHEFDHEVVAALSKMTADETLMHLETAMASGLIVEAEQLGRFRFDHILTAEAFARRASRLRRAKTFRALIDFEDLPSADRVRYIRGAVNAKGQIDSATAARLLWVEAQKLQEHLAFSEARSASEYAIDLLRSIGHDPPLEWLMVRAEVTARAGDFAQMERYRHEAFEVAASGGSADQMARAALVGLPSTERYAGDETMCDLLERVNASNISDRATRGMFMYHYLRSTRIIGRRTPTLHDADEISREDLDEFTWAELRAEYLQSEYQVQPNIEMLDEFAALADGLTASGPLTHLSFRSFIYGLRFQVADATTERYDTIRTALLHHPEPRVQWSFELLESALSLVGVLDTPTDAATALGTGFRLGVADAYVSFGAQSWHRLMRECRFEDAFQLLDGSRDIIDTNVGWQCAEAFNLAVLDRDDEAHALLAGTVANMRANPSGIWAPVAATLLVDACMFLEDSAEWAQTAVEILRPFSGTAIILGTGAAYFGPADLYLGEGLRILGEDGAAEEHLARGLEQAERTGFQRWTRL